MTRDARPGALTTLVASDDGFSDRIDDNERNGCEPVSIPLPGHSKGVSALETRGDSGRLHSEVWLSSETLLGWGVGIRRKSDAEGGRERDLHVLWLPM